MEGTSSPLFLYRKTDCIVVRETLEHLVQEALKNDEKLFLVDLNISDSKDIVVTIDGDQGVTIDNCIDINRYIEQNLDRDTYDYSLKVTSPGIDAPLQNIRQYKKNIGRTVKISTGEEKFEGTLEEIVDNNIVLTWKVREPKPIGKGKVTVTKKAKIALDDIKKAKVKIKF